MAARWGKQRKGGAVSNLDAAVEFFHACESAKGWKGCRGFAEPDATFHSAAATYAGVTTLQAYCDQIETAFTTTFVGSDYELVARAYDPDANIALLSGMSYAKHTGEGGPVPPTNKTAQIPFVYSITFGPAGKIAHLEKIYDQGASLTGLGWAKK